MRALRRPGVAGTLILVLIVALVLLSPEPGERGNDGEGPAGESASVRVTRVVDGDTVEVEIDGQIEDVRYIGVDTPESVEPGAPVECFGPVAAAFNRRLVGGRLVRLEFDRERRDVYGRLLAHVFVGGRLVSATLVRRGLARTLTIPPNTRFAPLLARQERRAAIAGRGLWGACGV